MHYDKFQYFKLIFIVDLYMSENKTLSHVQGVDLFIARPTVVPDVE